MTKEEGKIIGEGTHPAGPEAVFDTHKADEHKYALERTKVDRGWFGLVFGAPDGAPIFITASLLLILVIVLAIVLVWPSSTGGYDAAKLLVPIITLGLGYLFGKK